MKSLMKLWRVAADEYGGLCSVSTTRDYQTVASRVEDEGVSFLTITLPQFCSDFQKSLEEQKVSSELFQGFARQSGLPRFLGGFLCLIFDRATGVMVDSPNIDAIQAVRQLTLMFGKLELPTSRKRTAAAIRGFVDCEKDVKSCDARRGPAEKQAFRQMSRLLWSEALQRVDNALYAEHAGSRVSNPEWPYVVPKHGPGATADRKAGNRKYDFSEWTDRLESVFSYFEYALPNLRYHNRSDRVDFLDPGTERPVRVITVPKTLKTPRIIAIEPSYMQYMQQAIKALIVDSIRRDSALGKSVGFDDQWRNHALAREGSLTGALATLDLSEASDRVSNQLVREMLQPWPHLNEAVDATRSRKADVPGFGVIRLAKFASMGSALTFPMEAMVFTTVVFLGIQKSLDHQLKRADIRRLAKQVRIYGDDIIVPARFADDVIDNLELFGFKVNVNKSFRSGSFRESCGKEYFRGHDVSVVRVRKVVQKDGRTGFPSSRRFVRETESLVALRNRFYLNGMWRTAKWLDGEIRPLLGKHYPTLHVTPPTPWEEPVARSNVLGRWSVIPSRWTNQSIERIHPRYHTPLVRGWVVRERIPRSEVSGIGALLKVLSPRRVEPFEDPRHLERAGRPESSHMKLRWTVI